MAKHRAFDNLQESEILWCDRKRHLGMPVSFTKYTLDAERLYLNTGFFKSETNELLLYRILDIKCTRTLGQKLFGVGTVTLYCTDQSSPTLELKNVRAPEKVRRYLSSLVEQCRNTRGITGREIYGAAAGAGMAGDRDGDGIPDVLDADGDDMPG